MKVFSEIPVSHQFSIVFSLERFPLSIYSTCLLTYIHIYIVCTCILEHLDYTHTHTHTQKEAVQELNAEAKHQYKVCKDHKAALERYFKALDICKKCKLTEEAASIHGNCAHLLLQAGSFYQAYKHADACISLYPSYDKVSATHTCVLVNFRYSVHCTAKTPTRYMYMYMYFKL